MTWTEAAHPRNAKGPAGGEFKGGNTAATTAKPASKPGAKKAGPRRTTAAHGSMSFNGKTGTGYGMKNGDARVKKLQKLLNRLHLTDAQGRPLKVDGKLGPLTTAAVKKWQKRNGMAATGVVTPAMLAKAGKPAHRKTTTAHVRARAAKKAKAPKANVPPVRPKPY